MNRALAAAIVAATSITVAFPSVLIDLAEAGPRSSNACAVAVIGDTPYGAAQVERFPELVADVNRDPKVDLVLHVGDVRNGSPRCDDA